MPAWFPDLHPAHGRAFVRDDKCVFQQMPPIMRPAPLTPKLSLTRINR